MVDFVEASPLRIETMEEGTKILFIVDGILRTVTESSLRRNLKLQDEEGISSLPDTELFENLTLMGYNISPNQKFTFQKGQFSYQWKYLIHTIMQCLSPKSTWFNEVSNNIATSLVCLATNRTYDFSKMIFDGPVKNVNNKVSKFLMYPRQYTRRARITQSSTLPTVVDKPTSPLRDVSQGEACPTDFGFIADQDRATIVSPPPCLMSQHQGLLPLLLMRAEIEITRLKARVKLLEDRQGVAAEGFRDDAPIKGMVSLFLSKPSIMICILDSIMTSLPFLLLYGVTTVVVAKTRLVVGTISLPVGTSVAGGLSVGIDTLPVGTSAALLAKTVATSMDVSTVAISSVSSLALSATASPSSKFLPLIGASSLNPSAATPWEAAAERASDDTEEMATVLTSMDVATVLASGAAEVPTGSVSIPTDSPPAAEVPTGSDMVPTTSPVFATTTVMEDFIPIGSEEEAERIKRKGLSLEQESAKKEKTSEEVIEEAKSSDEVS
nr:synaptobrevin, longin-like domain protein [Tanacetum cinerariifolium]